MWITKTKRTECFFNFKIRTSEDSISHQPVSSHYLLAGVRHKLYSKLFTQNFSNRFKVDYNALMKRFLLDGFYEFWAVATAVTNTTSLVNVLVAHILAAHVRTKAMNNADR